MREAIENDNLIIYLDTIINTDNAREKEHAIFDILDKHPGLNLILDASDLEYISSAGLRILMKLRKKLAVPFEVRNVDREIYDIFETTGFNELLDIKRRHRSVDITGCEIIGKGFFGTVYRLNEDTIVKVYDSPESLGMIENEKKMARMAFLKGIPTAISYDIVQVNGSYGSVFELLNAKTFNDLVIEDPDHLDDTIDRYTDFLKSVHETEMDEGTLPSCTNIYSDHTDQIREYIDNETYDRLKTLFANMPHDLHVIHGDCQMKNVMLNDNEPMLIDMDTLSTGHPIFDLQGLYVTYMAFNEDEPDNSEHFLGISQETSRYIWNRFILRYLSDRSDEDLEKAVEKIRVAAYVRFLAIVTGSDLKNGALGEKRIASARGHLRELTSRIDDLVF